MALSKSSYIPQAMSLREREEDKNDPETLINFMSASRKDQFTTLANNNPKFLDLEKKFGKYLLMPLALPVFDIPDQEHFLSWWNSKCTNPTKLQGDVVMKGYGFQPFEAVDLLHTIGSDWDQNLQTESFKQEFPMLHQQFFDQIPCSKILNITLWSSIKSLPEHKDSTEYIDIPAAFRIKLYDENPEETLFVFDNPLRPYEIGEAKALPRLPGSNSYVWNNLRVKHGSTYDPKYKKILAVVAGIPDPIRYETLLDTSINMYNQHCLISDYSIENYVNI